MSSTAIRRLVMSVVPFTLTGVVVLMAIFGDHGLIRRHELQLQFVETERANEQVHRENAEMRRQIVILQTERKGVERLAAEELLMAKPGATIYRFAE